MDLNITHFFQTAAPMDYSASRAEIGDNAGPDTWRAACDDSEDYMILDDTKKRMAFRSFVAQSGGWTDDEIVAWNSVELNALCIQWIAGDIREAGIDTQNPDWEEYETGSNAGQYAGRISRGDNGQVYFYIGE